MSPDLDAESILNTVAKRTVKTSVPELRQFYTRVIQDAYSRLMKPSLTSKVMTKKKAWADEVSIQTFVSGITPAVANTIVDYRNTNGAFQSRQDLGVPSGSS